MTFNKTEHAATQVGCFLKFNLKNMVVIISFIVLSCFSVRTDSSSQELNMNLDTITRSELSKQIKKYVIKEMKKKKIVGLSIAVIDSAGVIISDGFGFSDKKKNILADNTTLFPIASITKTFTGIAIMQLVEKDLINLDKPIGDYIEELRLPNGEEKIITTRMLLTHHSGLQGDILYNWYLPEISHDPLVYEQILELINKTGTVFTPGKLYSYCNTGYSLLGVLVHKISGMPYVDYIHSHILSPLHMNNTIVYAGENNHSNISIGYNSKTQTTMPMILGIPAGGIALSSDDAVKYMQEVVRTYHGKGKLLKTETIHQMMTRQNDKVPIDEGFSMGLSWFLQDKLNELTTYASHRGELPPYHAMLIVLPELKTGVYISINTNKAADAPDEMAHKIIKDIYEIQKGKIDVSKKESIPVTLNHKKIMQHEGIYPNVYFGPMEVIAKKNKLLLKSNVIPIPMQLIPEVDSSYFIKIKLFGFIPLPIEMLDALRVEFRNIGSEKYLVFNIMNSLTNPNIRIKPYDIPKEYPNFVGRYEVTNMNNSERVVKNVKIIKGKKFYILTYTFLGRHKFNLALQPITDNTARIAGVGQFLGDKIKWETSVNNVKMYWSGLILEKR